MEGRVDILHVTTAHPNNDIRIFLKEVCSTAEAGISVGLLYAQFRAELPQVDHFQAFSIKPVRGRLVRMTLLPWRAFAAIRRIQPQVCHFHDPELMPVALVLRLLGQKIVYDAHEELDKQMLTKPYLHPLVRKPLSMAGKWIMRGIDLAADAVVAATPAIAEAHGNARSVTLVANYPLLTESVQPSPVDQRKKWVVYVGQIGKIRGIVQLVQAAERLPQDVEVIVCGTFETGTLDEVSQMSGWSRIDYRGQVDRSAMLEIMSKASVGVVNFLAAPNHVESLPNKIFEYMSAGLPVVCSNFPLWQGLMEETGAGLCVDPEDPAAIADAIIEILNDGNKQQVMSDAGVAAIKSRNWSVSAENLIALYRRILSPS